MAANSRFIPWTDKETDTLIRMYQAGHYWRDIVPAVSAASGNPRSKDSCRKKAGDLMLTATRPRDYNRAVIDQGDLEDVILLGYSRARAAMELGVAEVTFSKNVKEIGGNLRTSWMKAARKRQLAGLAAGREEMKRRGRHEGSDRRGDLHPSEGGRREREGHRQGSAPAVLGPRERRGH